MPSLAHLYTFKSMPKTTVALGVDPGLRGALALVTKHAVIATLDLAPSAEKGAIVNLDVGSIASFLGAVRDGIELCGGAVAQPDIVVIEDVRCQGNAEGRVSMFKFGESKGVLFGLLFSHFPDTPIIGLKPNVWKPQCGLSRNKKDSLSFAKKQWPNQADLFKRVKDSDRAEASILGLCGIKIKES